MYDPAADRGGPAGPRPGAVRSALPPCLSRLPSLVVSVFAPVRGDAYLSVRRAVALALSATLGFTGLAAAGSAAVAETASDAPYEVTIGAPADTSAEPDMILVGAGTGVQMMRGGEIAHPIWQSLKDGRVAHAPLCEPARSSGP